MQVSAADLMVFWTVVLVRFLLPLSIPKFPLPAILACLAVDALDKSIFSSFTHLDMAGYQSYDKALDIFYLSLAMLATLRNWSSLAAVRIARALFYFRLVGVLAFEMTGWRATLVLAPNTFEYFFILYELVRSRWSPVRMSRRFYVTAAATIWVAVKLPQEYWIHIARLDTTDVLKARVLGADSSVGWGQAVSDRPMAFALLILGSTLAIAAGLALGRRLLGPAVHTLALSADPLPETIDEAWERDREIADRWRLLDLHLLEKIVLAGLVTVIFARVLPDVNASPAELFGGVAAIVTVNALLRLQAARTSRSIESVVLAFVVLALLNAALAVLAHALLRRHAGSLPWPETLFFLLLLTLIVTLYDRWRPVCDVRFEPAPATFSRIR